MTPIADMVRRMLEKGVPQEAIIMAVEGAELAMAAANSTGIPPDSTAEKRRAYDRQRKRNSTGIPPESTGTPRSPSLSKELKEEREGSAHRIPPEWQPSLEDRGFASEEGFAAAEIDREIAKFRDYWISVPGGKGVKLDWSPMWRKWIRDGADRRKREAVASATSTSTSPTANERIDWDATCATFKKTGIWSRWAGPDPQQAGCRCPTEVLQKYGLKLREAAAR